MNTKQWLAHRRQFWLSRHLSEALANEEALNDLEYVLLTELQDEKRRRRWPPDDDVFHQVKRRKY